MGTIDLIYNVLPQHLPVGPGGAAQHISCGECINMAEVLRDFLVYNESIISEQDTITTKICPEADLGDADAHPNCEKFTAHHWVDLATALFPALIDANKFCTDTLVCSKMLTENAELSCDSCLAVMGGVGALLGEVEIIANMVGYIQSEFCVTGVPEPDAAFCVEYSQKVLPAALPIFSRGMIEQAHDLCNWYFNTCQ